MTGTLDDGQLEIPLSDLKLADRTFTFRFYINGKPYVFEGKVDGKRLEGKFSGEEANGKLRCLKPTT